MNEKNIIYSVMEGGYIHCHTNGTIYKNYDEFKKEMLCYYGKEELINKINNLQSKIDKAIEYINTWVVDEYSICIQDPEEENFCYNEPQAVDKLLDILKEDK